MARIGPLAATILALLLAGCGAARAPAPAGQAPAVYASSQERAAEATLGYHVVQPSAAVRGASGLRLSEVVVTQVGGRRIIHYLYGNLHSRWVLILEAPAPAGAYTYDPVARDVQFTARGCGIIVTTNLSLPTLDAIVRRLGGPRRAAPL